MRLSSMGLGALFRVFTISSGVAKLILAQLGHSCAIGYVVIVISFFAILRPGRLATRRKQNKVFQRDWRQPDDLDDRGREMMESMMKIQALTTPHKPAAKRRMYRGILKAPAICDCFVRATSDMVANAAMKAGKGQKAKPRFGSWELWQEAIAVDTYTASEIPAQEIPNSGLTEQELEQIYMAVQHNISVICGMGVYTEKEWQGMADAVREFYNLLREAVRPKTAQQPPLTV